MLLSSRIELAAELLSLPGASSAPVGGQRPSQLGLVIDVLRPSVRLDVDEGATVWPVRFDAPLFRQALQMCADSHSDEKAAILSSPSPRKTPAACLASFLQKLLLPSLTTPASPRLAAAATAAETIQTFVSRSRERVFRAVCGAADSAPPSISLADQL